jgi:hypothetical protein
LIVRPGFSFLSISRSTMVGDQLPRIVMPVMTAGGASNTIEARPPSTRTIAQNAR